MCLNVYCLFLAIQGYIRFLFNVLLPRTSILCSFIFCHFCFCLIFSLAYLSLGSFRPPPPPPPPHLIFCLFNFCVFSSLTRTYKHAGGAENARFTAVVQAQRRWQQSEQRRGRSGEAPVASRVRLSGQREFPAAQATKGNFHINMYMCN